MPRTKEKMVGTQLLVTADQRDRGRALAIVRKESVAGIWRAAAFGKGIVAMEKENAADLDKLQRTLHQLADGWSVSDGLDTMIRKGMNLTDLFDERGELKPWE